MGRKPWWQRDEAADVEAAADLSDDQLRELAEGLKAVNKAEGEPRQTSPGDQGPPNGEASPGEESSEPSPDALVPWGPGGPPPLEKWVPDVLGDKFEVRVSALQPDEEGGVLTSLVRRVIKGRRAKRAVKFAFLYIHGRNDYFFHEELAEDLAGIGAAFYALDLRKYGRSLRPWQTIGYADDLTVYDEDLAVAVATIRNDHPDIPLVVYGHSTGGLIATLWAWRNPGIADALVLNSAWLELQSLTTMRPALHQVVSRLAAVRPRATVVGQSKINGYYRSIAEGWAQSGFPLPDSLVGYEDDPAVTGWNVRPEWKLPFSYPAPAAWMQAVLEGHAQIEKQVHLECPVLSMMSSSSHNEEQWTPDYFSSDVVLNADILAQRSAHLSNNVTIVRFPGKHDLMLSDPEVRQDVYATIERWLKFIQIL